MCSLKSNLRVSAHWFAREPAFGGKVGNAGWLNSSAVNSTSPPSSIGTSLGCHHEINQITFFSSVALFMEMITRKSGSYLRQRRQSLLLHIPEQLVDGKLQAFVNVELGHVDSYQDPAFPGRFGWGLVVFERRLIGTHRQVFFSLNRYFSEISFFASKFTHLKWLALQLPTYYTIFDYSTLFASQPD